MDKQILKFDGKNVFVEIMSGCFPIGKVAMNFIEYNPNSDKGSKQTKKLPVYMNIEDFEVLAQDILSGRIAKQAKEAREAQKSGGYKFCKEIFTDMGGVSAKKLAQKGQSRADNKSLSRQFKITPGDKIPWILKAEHGPGEENETGLIVPQGRPEQYVQVGLSDKDFKKFAIVVANEIQAYRIATYTLELSKEAREAKSNGNTKTS